MYKIITKKSIQQQKAYYSLSSVQNVVRDTMKTYNNTSRFDSFCQNLYKVYLFERSQTERLEKLKTNSLNACLVSQEPLLYILKQFAINNKFGFNQDLIVQTLYFLSKTHKSFEINHYSKTDYTIKQVHNSWRFQDLIQDIQYGLKNASFSYQNLSNCLKSLSDIDYKNQTLQLNCFKRIFQDLQGTQEINLDLTNLQNNYQLHKPYYYDTVDTKNIFKNDNFIQNLNLLLQDYQTTVSDKHQSDEIQGSINAILEEIRLNQKNVALIARSILNLRDQYCKLVENQQLVIQNPNINIEMLEIEEILVQLGLLNVDELRNINLLKEKNYTELQVTQIVKDFLHGNNEELGLYLERLMRFNANEQTASKNTSFEIKENIDYESISDCLLYLSQIATKRVSEANEENYISDDWKNQLKVNRSNQELIQQELLEEKNPEYMRNREEKILEDVNCDLYYLSIYQESIQQFKDLAKVLDFQKFSVQSKFKLVLAYLNLGLGQEATRIWGQIKDNSNFEQPSDLINLIKIFNKSNYEVSDKLKNLIFEKIQKFYQSEFQISELLEIATFLISFKESDSMMQEVLKLIELNSQNIQGDNEFLEQLLDIGLYLQYKGVESFQFAGLKYLENNMKPKRIDPLREKLINLFKFKNSQFVDFQLQGLPLSFQPDITVASIENGKISKKGFFFLDSENYAENIVSNRIKNRFDLIEKNTGFQCEAVFTSQFLEYKDGKIKFLNNQQLTNLFKKLQKQSKFQPIQIILQSLNGNYDNLSIDLIRSKLSQFLKLEDEINLQIETLALGSLEQMKYILFQVIQIYQQLPQIVQDKIFKDFEKIIRESIKLLQKQTGQLTNIDLMSQNQWIGMRLSTDLLNSKQEKNILDSFQFIDYKFWTDSNYHQYESWKKVMEKNLGVSNLSFVKSQQNQVSKIVPPIKGSRSIYRPLSYPWNWESIYFEKINSEKKQSVEQLVIQESSTMNEQIHFMSNLQNFKYELKMQKDHNKLSQMLLEFDFIEELISTHLGDAPPSGSPKQLKQIQRDINDYFLYKENINQTDLYSQDLLNFLVENIQKKDKIVQILKAKSKLKQVFKEYKEGKVTKQFYKNLEKKIETNLLQALQEFNQQNEQENQLFQGQSPKFLNIKYDVQQLLKDKQITQYSRFFDDDFIQQDGDSKKILDCKRFKAEQKLIKLRILKKLQSNITLTTNEQKYANLWSNNKLKIQQFSQRDINSLSQNDKNVLKSLQLSDITQFNDFSLNDFIFEFSLFFSSDLIKQVELQLKKKILPEINIDFLTNNKNSNLSNFLIIQLEENSWQKGQFLQPQEIEDLNSILNILKDKTSEDKKKLKKELEIRKSAFEEINKSQHRLELLEKWINARDRIHYSQRDKSEQEKQFTQIWQMLFKCEYERTSENHLAGFIEEFVQRLFLLEKKKFIGFDYFIGKLFSHKNLPKQSNQTLQAMLQIIDLECHLDCQDIVQMCKNQQLPPHSKEQIKEQIRRASNSGASDLSIKLMNYA